MMHTAKWKKTWKAVASRVFDVFGAAKHWFCILRLFGSKMCYGWQRATKVGWHRWFSFLLRQYVFGWWDNVIFVFAEFYVCCWYCWRV